MNYSIDEQKVVITNVDGIEVVRCVIYAASAVDIPSYDDFVATEKKQLAPGSVAVIPSTSAVYMLDFDNEWKVFGGAS